MPMIRPNCRQLPPEVPARGLASAAARSSAAGERGSALVGSIRSVLEVADAAPFYYYLAQLQAVRSGKWKLIFPRKQRNKQLPLRLIDLDSDIHEDTNVASQNPDVVARLTKLADRARTELGDDKKPGSGQRPAGMVAKPTARVLGK
jgi:arylsulfatase A-like enzyme